MDYTVKANFGVKLCHFENDNQMLYLRLKIAIQPF